MSSIVKMIVSSSLLQVTLSVLPTDKTECFHHLSFNSTLQLINGIPSYLEKLLKYFIDTAVVAFFRIPLAAFGAG